MARLIKRYGSRKLYDTGESRYVLLEEIADWIRAGEEIHVVDNKTGEDVTTQTLTQVISEEGRKRSAFWSSEMLHDLIRAGESAVNNRVRQFQEGMDRLVKAGFDRFVPMSTIRDEMGQLRERLAELEKAVDAAEKAEAEAEPVREQPAEKKPAPTRKPRKRTTATKKTTTTAKKATTTAKKPTATKRAPAKKKAAEPAAKKATPTRTTETSTTTNAKKASTDGRAVIAGAKKIETSGAAEQA